MIRGNLKTASVIVAYIHNANVRACSVSSFFEEGKKVVRKDKGANVTDVRYQKKRYHSHNLYHLLDENNFLNTYHQKISSGIH